MKCKTATLFFYDTHDYDQTVSVIHAQNYTEGNECHVSQWLA